LCSVLAFNDLDSTAWTDGDEKIIAVNEQQYGHDFYCPGIEIQTFQYYSTGGHILIQG
jgi:hypothetical protein